MGHRSQSLCSADCVKWEGALRLGQWSGSEVPQASSDFMTQQVFTSLDSRELTRDYGPGPMVAKVSCIWLLTHVGTDTS